MLSPEVLRCILAKADQATRVAACASARRVFDAAAHPSVWRRTTVYSPDTAALTYLRRVRPETVHLVHHDARAVESFLEGMRAQGLAASVTALDIDIGAAGRLPCACALLDYVAEFERLEELAITLRDVPQPTCLAFGAGCVLPRLRAIKIWDRSATRKLEVYLVDAKLPELRAVDVEAATCDVLARVPEYPRLRSVRYVAQDESFEDANLDGARLEVLDVDVRDTLAMHFLEVALARARYIEHVYLGLRADARFEAFVNTRHVHITLHEPAASVVMAYAALRGLGTVVVEADRDTAFTLRVEGVGSWHTFKSLMQSTALFVGVGGKVVVDPV